METIVALSIVIAAGALVFHRFYKQAQNGSACDCECNRCRLHSDCEAPENFRLESQSSAFADPLHAAQSISMALHGENRCQ